jgi:hypothetical protein
MISDLYFKNIGRLDGLSNVKTKKSNSCGSSRRSSIAEFEEGRFRNIYVHPTSFVSAAGCNAVFMVNLDVL